MFKGKKILGIIPARGGSKGIKDKNIRPLAGKPLIAHTIEAGLASKYVDDVLVSTDSEKIAEISMRYGADVPFLRPAELASDTSKTIEAIMHAIQTLRAMGRAYDSLVLLQPTSPLRTKDDIDCAVELFYNRSEAPLASVNQVSDHPLLIRSIDENGNMVHLLNQGSTCRRQDMPSYYRINGAIYIYSMKDIDSQTSFNDAVVPFIMDSNKSVDIDSLDDLDRAERLLMHRH